MTDQNTAVTYRVRRLAVRRTVKFAVVRVGPDGARSCVTLLDTELAAGKVAGLLTRLERINL